MNALGQYGDFNFIFEPHLCGIVSKMLLTVNLYLTMKMVKTVKMGKKVNSKGAAINMLIYHTWSKRFVSICQSKQLHFLASTLTQTLTPTLTSSRAPGL